TCTHTTTRPRPVYPTRHPPDLHSFPTRRSSDLPPAERAEVRKSLGLDDPVIVQFARYVGNAAQFKFGVSYQFRQPVTALLMERMPATLELATCATVLAMVFGILMGVYSALRRDTL